MFSEWSDCDSWCGGGQKYRYRIDERGNEILGGFDKTECDGNDLYCGLSMGLPAIVGLIVIAIIYWICR